MMKTLFKLIAVIPLLFSIQVNSQVLITEDFDNSGLPAGWTTTGFSQTTLIACDGGSVRRNFYSFNASGDLTSPNGLTAGEDIEISFDYKIIDWSNPNPATTGNFGIITAEYSLDGGNSWTVYETIDENTHIPSTNCTTINFTLPGTTAVAGSNFQWRLNGAWTSGDYFFYVDNFSAVELTNCSAPSNLAVISNTFTDVELGWTNGGTETQWNIEYGAPGFTQGTGTTINVTSNPAVISGLPTETEFEFYLQAECGPGDQSAWIGPVQAYTGYCLPVYTSTSDYLTLFETTGAIQNVNYTASSQPSQGYENLSGVDTIKVEQEGDFDFETNFQGGSNTVKIWVDWNEDLVFDASEEVYVGTTPSSAPLHQQLGNVSIPSTVLQGDYRMRVRSFFGTTHSSKTACQSHSFGSALDFTLQILPPASCPRPSDIIAQNITANTAEISWTVTGTETEWEIEYDTTGFTQGSGNFTTTTTNPYTITGLTGNTSYQAYVRGICAPGDTSDWRGPVTLTTPCETFMAPFFEGFEDGVQPDCWDNITNNTPGTSANVFWRFGTGVTGGAANNGKPAGTYAWVDGSSPTPDTTLLITPFIDLSALSTPALGFEWFSNNTTTPGDNMPLVVALFDGNTWTNIDTLSGDSTEWRYEFYDLSAWAGQTIRISFNVDQTATTSFAFNNDILLDDVEINDCTPAPGVDGNEDVCRLDEEINLFDYITPGVSGGKWEFPINPALIMNDSILNISTLPSGTFEAIYITTGICTSDTTIATLNIFPPSSAGDNGTLEVCMNEPIDLFSGLNGVINLGGTWYDPQDNALPNSLPTASSIPGSYNYDYIVSNGVCPADTQYVEVIVKSTCDYLSVGEAELGNIEVYPNPATDVIKIDNNSNAEALVIEVMDMNGRLVLSDANALFNNNHASISIESLETGVYTLRLSNKEGQRTFKVVKQ